jgi:polar amino acid transport system ATP-binding protein
MRTPVIEARSLVKHFGPLQVLRGIDLVITEGERIAILGASGSGKSTLLRCLNFMELPTSGRILFRGETVGTARPDGSVRYGERALAALRTRVGMVFQQFNLFPHMTVLENVAEGPRRVLRKSKREAEVKAAEKLARVGLADKVQQYPSRLSGGQQQRVAIARALAMEPDVLLLDEPTSSLDPELVGEVLRVIRALAEEGRTMLLVTHEVGFAYHFASRVLFLHEGNIYEEGTPDEVLKNPQRERTRAFLAGFSEFAF